MVFSVLNNLPTIHRIIIELYIMNKKIKKLAWTNDMVKVIASNHKTKSTTEIADLINEQFNVSKTPMAIWKKANAQGFSMSKTA